MQIELQDAGRTVNMRVPLVRDMRVVSKIKDQTEQDVRMISNLCEMTPEEIDELTIRDYRALQEALLGFLS